MTPSNGTIDGTSGLRRIGGGWGNFVALEEAEYQGPTESGISRREHVRTPQRRHAVPLDRQHRGRLAEQGIRARTSPR